ncbi:ABC transporter ATP-binding protein [Novosphingobium tardum]|uniref:ABC transporter ATP-binding protein n=1 Tax=Novosphingobium tardum TaxID=1538021 RepID=A0ABV8RTA3_9SPHN
MTALASVGLAVSLSGRSVLAGVDAVLRAREVTAICGPNGAGKSTLLAALAGLRTPDSGTVTLNDQPLASLDRDLRARTLGYLPQAGEIAWDIDVATLAGLGRLPWRASPAENEAAVAAALAALDLEAFAARRVSRLSGGERARALLARVLAGTPAWILADEPLASLDLAHAATLVAHFRHAARSDGIGVILVLHDLAQAMNHADRVLVLDAGRIVADGAPEVALDEGVLKRVWGVSARWLGEPGARALAVG